MCAFAADSAWSSWCLLLSVTFGTILHIPTLIYRLYADVHLHSRCPQHTTPVSSAVTSPSLQAQLSTAAHHIISLLAHLLKAFTPVLATSWSPSSAENVKVISDTGFLTPVAAGCTMLEVPTLPKTAVFTATIFCGSNMHAPHPARARKVAINSPPYRHNSSKEMTHRGRANVIHNAVAFIHIFDVSPGQREHAHQLQWEAQELQGHHDPKVRGDIIQTAKLVQARRKEAPAATGSWHCVHSPRQVQVVCMLPRSSA